MSVYTGHPTEHYLHSAKTDTVSLYLDGEYIGFTLISLQICSEGTIILQTHRFGSSRLIARKRTTVIEYLKLFNYDIYACLGILHN